MGGTAHAFEKRSNAGGLKFLSPVILAFLLASCASMAGCVGTTGAPKTSTSSSSQPVGQPVGHFVTLTWVPPSATDVTAYNVYRSKSVVGPFLRMATVAATENAYVDNNVQGGETYYYVLTSVGLGGTESADSTTAIAPVP